MRFLSNGPNIPDILLERCDQGRVVFLCGAGVSRNADMPTFYGLTEYVLNFFDPPETSAIATSFRPWREGEEGPKTPFDQIFHILYQEYGREDVNSLVAERLQMRGESSYEGHEHQLIARISSDQEGHPQIVTTNFDRLFEHALAEGPHRIYEPPAFPDIHLGVPITGITYLHGRLQEPGARHHPYVLSSADFGRAYLSEGWATNFIRSLLEHYTVVLVGYQAEDPPVKYLLQGLNHDEMSDRSKLYAFDRGLTAEVESKWRDKGVTAIAYNDHNDLWQTLEAWADRADDPRSWRSRIVDLAQNSPRQLEAHERGQVAHLVRTAPGARLFADAIPTPPSEWLCVFDASCRSAKKSSGYTEDAETFDPLEIYGLDDDPPRAQESEPQDKRIYDHILEWNRGDTNPPTFHRICGRQPAGFEDIPPRLLRLSFWIAKQLDSPLAAWWALRQNGLHPQLVEQIRRELRKRNDLHPKAQHVWSLILDYESDTRVSPMTRNWFDIADRINNEGWSPSVLRDFDSTTSPHLVCGLPFGICASKPPFKEWEKVTPDELTRWEVKFPERHDIKIEIPDESLLPVFRIVEGQLHRAVGFLEDTDTTYYPTPTCYPERDVGGEERYINDVGLFFEWFIELFSRVITDHPSIARAHSVTWPTTDIYFFRKLKLFALNHAELFNADEAAEITLKLDEEAFWDREVCRELLFLLHDRWTDFSETNRLATFERILNGPAKREYWSDDEYHSTRDEFACRYAKWLTLQGLSISTDHATQLDSMIRKLPEWHDSWALNLVTEHHSHAGIVRTDETPDAIINLPVNEVVEKAKSESRREFGDHTEKRPFTGLVKTNPRKALASLSHSAKSGVYPISFWNALINEWPEEATPRLFCVFLNRLIRLSDETIYELRHTVGQWLEKRFLSAYQYDEELAWKTFDHLATGLVSAGGTATRSRVVETRFGGEAVEKSRRTYGHAINGPIGEAVEGLFHTLNDLKLDRGQGIPEKFKARIECLLAAPGEGGDHAVAIVTHQISWLYYLDPTWVMNRIMPWFNFEHPASEPAWNGYLSAARIPHKDIGAALKPQLLELFPAIYSWSWGRDLAEVATQMIVELAVFRGTNPDGLTHRETRNCLRSMNDQNRRSAVTRLGQIGKREENGWSNHVIPFINAVWPRERTFITSTLVSSWVSILDDAGDDFPSVLAAVRKFLVPIEHESHWLYRFSREIGGEQPLTNTYPEDVLELLNAIIPNSVDNVPYDLKDILALIEEVDSSLSRDRRFLRLIELVERF